MYIVMSWLHVMDKMVLLLHWFACMHSFFCLDILVNAQIS
jgi:hypothetical protein